MRYVRIPCGAMDLAAELLPPPPSGRGVALYHEDLLFSEDHDLPLGSGTGGPLHRKLDPFPKRVPPLRFALQTLRRHPLRRVIRSRLYPRSHTHLIFTPSYKSCDT